MATRRARCGRKRRGTSRAELLVVTQAGERRFDRRARIDPRPALPGLAPPVGRAVQPDRRHRPNSGNHAPRGGGFGYACGVGTAARVDLLSVEDYLASELVSPIKHEYVGGVVYAMAGARNLHNVIKGNAFANLHVRLRGRGCRPFDSDTKVRVRLPTQVRFYYPDASVVCHPNPPTDSYQDEPVVIVEVLSRKTRRIDEGEKRDAYLSMPSLSVYLLVEQEAALVIAHRRTDRGFVREVYSGTSAVIPLPEIGTDLPLSEIYDGAELVAEQDD